MEFRRNTINQRVLSDLKMRSSFGIPFYLLLAFIVLFTTDYYLNYLQFSCVFFIALGVISIFRFTHVLLFKRLRKWNEGLNKTVFILSILFTSTIWGAGFAYFMLQDGEYYSVSLMAICTAGLCGGGVVAFYPSRMLAIAFDGLIMLPAFLVLVIRGANLSLAIMILFYFCYMVVLAFRGNEEYWTALENEVKLQEQSDTLRKLSRIDVLTGLYNRRYFDENFEAEWKRASREGTSCTVVLGDIDHFKKVNDTYGHLAGDSYLKKMAEILSSVFQRKTDVVARFGGEEFVILLPDTDLKLAYELTEKIRSIVEQTRIEYQGKHIGATVSFGIASRIPDFKDSNQTLLNMADKALYQAKQAGRNRIVLANVGHKPST
jgi:diguanylate cyclase (GGDEF)-like protein